jgi:membrane-associated phospholipid phosphatase
MPLLVDLTLAFAAGLAALVTVALYSRSSAVPARPAPETARALGAALGSRPGLRRLLRSRLDREVATGFLLTLALAIAVSAGIVLGLLAYLVRALPALRHADRSVAAWAFDHRTTLSTTGLDRVTSLGTAQVVIALALLVAAFDFIRTHNRWCVPFLVAVLAGMELITLGVKDLVGRVRPALVPAAAHLGPSFPSGHSATAASFYAAAALVLGRTLGLRGRQLLAAIAVGLAIAVAASRVLLDLHWLSDVIGGLALGWGWFALCAVLFGGRLLRPTAAVDTAAATADTGTTPTPPSRLSGTGDRASEKLPRARPTGEQSGAGSELVPANAKTESLAATEALRSPGMTFSLSRFEPPREPRRNG